VRRTVRKKDELAVGEPQRLVIAFDGQPTFAACDDVEAGVTVSSHSEAPRRMHVRTAVDGAANPDCVEDVADDVAPEVVGGRLHVSRTIELETR
jgi:hypothetical protein